MSINHPNTRPLPIRRDAEKFHFYKYVLTQWVGPADEPVIVGLDTLEEVTFFAKVLSGPYTVHASQRDGDYILLEDRRS
jgi:hypothetical protein